ncbi:hypothetical protein [Streptomyces sp. NPDC008137]|uniref:hypothetical protein n=1 Tax=Streptomyces sp. NPDC008137 TaxID=3364813 RepID=UPI0036E755A1
MTDGTVPAARADDTVPAARAADPPGRRGPRPLGRHGPRPLGRHGCSRRPGCLAPREPRRPGKGSTLLSLAEGRTTTDPLADPATPGGRA